MKGVIIMEKNVVLDILKSTENLLHCNNLPLAKEYVRLEIDNLEGTTPQKCRSPFKNSAFYHCDKCLNKNCPDNRNQKSS